MKIRQGVDIDVKLCPGCKGASLGPAEIFKNFGKDRYRPDGLHVYCRNCRRKNNVRAE